MPSFHAHRTVFISLFLAALSAPVRLVSAYVINSNALTPLHQMQPSSALASKVIYQSPPSAMENIYKDLIISSKPLNLRKYANGMKKKKSKKDSKIYYIPIPPLPYRFIPGVGYDYQPMKINPIMMETSSPPPLPVVIKEEDAFAPSSSYGGFKLPQPQFEQHYPKYPLIPDTIKPSSNVGNRIDTDDSKIIRMHRGDYFFNGRPFRLQVAHALSKHQLTPHNLKSKLYFNKKLIY